MAKRKFGIAVDIGTTTIEAALISENGEIARTSFCPNAGARFGADVMSRIRAASEGHGEELSALLKQDITEAIRKLLAEVYDADGGVSVTYAGGPETDGADTQGPPPMAEPASCTAIVLAGNTAMLHMLNGYDCSGLGVYPYSPVTLAWEEKSVQDLFPDLPANCAEARVILLPGISAFVGADITAGLYACGLAEGSPVKPASAKTQEPASVDGSPVKPASAETQEPASAAGGASPVSGQTTLFLDLGTNGEMALITPDDRTDRAGNTRIRVCSTAAGPVFEGAGIRDGMRGTSGAIAEVVLVPGAGRDPAPAVQTRCRTIDNAPAVGICGSGVLEAVSELIRLHLIDKDGLLSEPWFTEGFPLARRADGTWIRLYQEDIRAVQLAKAAIRAGMETLPLACGIPARTIDRVLVAGAFGRALSFSRLAPLGLFPPELIARCRTVGNTSLKGAARTAAELLQGSEQHARAAFSSICDNAGDIPLAGRQDFEACYINMMGF